MRLGEVNVMKCGIAEEPVDHRGAPGLARDEFANAVALKPKLSLEKLLVFGGNRSG